MSFFSFEIYEFNLRSVFQDPDPGVQRYIQPLAETTQGGKKRNSVHPANDVYNKAITVILKEL